MSVPHPWPSRRALMAGALGVTIASALAGESLIALKRDVLSFAQWPVVWGFGEQAQALPAGLVRRHASQAHDVRSAVAVVLAHPSAGAAVAAASSAPAVAQTVPTHHRARTGTPTSVDPHGVVSDAGAVEPPAATDPPTLHDAATTVGGDDFTTAPEVTPAEAPRARDATREGEGDVGDVHEPPEPGEVAAPPAPPADPPPSAEPAAPAPPAGERGADPDEPVETEADGD
jgi:hypothetical protein